MLTEVSWTRVYHQAAIQPCDIGTPPRWASKLRKQDM
jgi:hypothetical protein